MFHCIVFGRIPELACFGIHFNQRVLIPSPRACSPLGKQEIPVEPLVATVPHIVANQEKRMLSRLPVHRSVSALAFRTDVMIFRILLADSRQDFTSLPLKSQSADAPAQFLVTQDSLHMILAVGIEGSQIKLHIRMMLLQCRSKIIAIEAHRPFRRPCTARIRRIAVCLILINHHVNVYSFTLVSLDELAEKIGVRLKVTGILNEIILRGKPAGKLPFPLAQKLHFILVHFI